MAARLPPTDNVGLNMTPMIDIVFNLVTAYQYFRDKAAKIAVDFGGVVEDMLQRYRK